MKHFNEVALVSVLVIYLTGIITVGSAPPQPMGKTPDEQLPPEVFPKEDSNGSIPHHLQGELPPAIFPDDKALAQLHADSITKSTSKNDLNNKNNIKDTELDDKSNKTAAGSKTTKVASEIPDLLNTDYMNITTYDDGTENPINNDTETVKGPHVINDNKTHDEDASSVQRNCSASESSQENNSTLKNECASDATKNETIEENHSNDKNDSSINTSTELTKEPEIKQNSTENVIETTTTNEEYENVTDIAEPKNVEDSLSTVEYNTTIGLPTTENSTVVTENKSDNATVEVQSKSDSNTTPVDKSTTPATKETVGTTKQTSTDSSTTTELPSANIETTSVNISENIIDHKSGSPVALATSQEHADHSHGSSGKSSAFLQPTESAAILAGVFVGIALLGYVGLLVWRRILEKRYGNREMLVNEDDFYDTNDLRNFEL